MKQVATGCQTSPFQITKIIELERKVAITEQQLVDIHHSQIKTTKNLEERTIMVDKLEKELAEFQSQHFAKVNELQKSIKKLEEKLRKK